MNNNNAIVLNKQAFLIYGEPASKANSRRAVTFKGKPRFIKSSKALNYEKMFKQQIAFLPGSSRSSSATPRRKQEVLFKHDVVLEIYIYYASRRPDLDESLILDLLQGVAYENDRQVKEKHIYWGLDKENPRSEIFVWEKEIVDNIPAKS